MTEPQRIAYQSPCFLAEDARQPQFRRAYRLQEGILVSVLLTLNIGQE
jgi:hypothetical protein